MNDWWITASLRSSECSDGEGNALDHAYRSGRAIRETCTTRGISFRRIATSDVRTPDYGLSLTSTRVLVEVKQLEPNASDIAFEEQLRSGLATRMVDMGRAKLAINDAVKQLRPHAKGLLPAIVVLYDTMRHTNYLDPYSLSFSRYGPEKMHFAVPTDPSLEISALGMSRGGDAVATPKHNTTLSAVAVLDGTAQALSLDLRIFHNCNAATPLPLNAFAEYGFRQFEFAVPRSGTMPTWIERTA